MIIIRKSVIAAKPAAASLITLLDERIFPAIVAYVVHRAHIIALLFIGVVLMISPDPIVQLKLGNYTNVCSALVACIVLLQQIDHHKANMAQHSKHTKHIQRLHKRLDTMEQQQKAGNA